MTQVNQLHKINRALVPIDEARRPWCYVAGPMRGIEEFNFPAFEDAAALLRSLDFNVYSPRENDAELDMAPGMPLKRYMVVDLAQVCKSDCIFVLPGWEHSQGAWLEFQVATYLEIPVFDLASGGQVTIIGTDPDGSHVIAITEFEDALSRSNEFGEPNPGGIDLDAIERDLGAGCSVGYLTPNEEIQRAAVQAWDERLLGGIPSDVSVINLEEVNREWEQRMLDSKIREVMMADDSKATNPKDRVGSSKLPLHLWPTTATALGSLGLLDGMLKYGRSNWRAAGIRWTIYYDAIMRHLQAIHEGENIDPDSGLPHMAHVLACAAIIVDADAVGMLQDDRQYNGVGYRVLIGDLTPEVERLKEKHADRDPRHYDIGDHQ